MEESEQSNDSFNFSSSDELIDIEEQIEKENAEESFMNQEVCKDDYILVRFSTKKTFRHYVAKVININGNDYDLLCMRLKPPGYTFIFPDVADECCAPRDALVKLPNPSFTGGTARAHRALSFPVDFSEYENLFYVFLANIFMTAVFFYFFQVPMCIFFC